jgi:prepilin-type N-terminal cleavage/methylation domain-containing protein
MRRHVPSTSDIQSSATSCVSRSFVRRPRHGLTLIELLISSSIMAMTALALGVLARAVQISCTYTEGNTTAALHGRVILERIQNAVVGATANETFPGAVVFAETVSGYRFPDTLVIWKPTTAAVNPSGLPLFSELVVYCPNPTIPNQLLEITSPSDTRSVPALSSSSWTSELTTLKTGSTSRKVVLTDLMRAARVSSTSTARGCVRFEVDLHPSAADISSFRGGSTAWEDLPWPQHWYGQTTGMRQTWVRTELQLMPNSSAGGAAADSLAIPFLGSAALYYEITR